MKKKFNIFILISVLILPFGIVQGQVKTEVKECSGKKIQLGYNIEKDNVKLSAAVDVVYAADLEKFSVINPEESLYGLLTGLGVMQNGGLPWNRNPGITIRGKSTFNDNSILILVDGFERDIASLTVAEIESVAVLKDAAALAVYGQRGANGVILVTTKRGEYESFKVDVNYENGVNMPFRIPEFLNGYQYAMAVNEASALDGNPFIYSEYDLLDFQNRTNPDFYPSVDWFDEAFRDYGTSSQFHTNFSGGGKSAKYFVLLGYQDENGLFDNTTMDDRYDSQLKYKRLNFRTNLDIKLSKSTLFQLNVAGMIDTKRQPGAQIPNIMNELYSVPSGAFPVKTSDGVWGGTEYYSNNPIALVTATGSRLVHGREINVNGLLKQDLSSLISGLSAEAAIAFDNRAYYNEGKTKEFLYGSNILIRDDEGLPMDTTSLEFGTETDMNAYDNFGGQRRHSTVFGKLNYNKEFGSNVLNATILYNMDKRVNDGQYNTFLHQNIVALASYGISQKYFFDATVAYSGSSRLPNGEKFGIFPAISGAWIVSNENFIGENNSISFLKIRASWGLTGNDIMETNLFDQKFTTWGNYFFTDNLNNFGVIREGRLPTENLIYEQGNKSNFGIDITLADKLDVKLDAFYEKRTNILTATSGITSQVIGVAEPFQNNGIVENKGIETSVFYRQAIGELKFHIGGNFAFARNRIIEMNEEFMPFDYLNATENPIGQQFGLETVGFFKDEADIENSNPQMFSNLRPGDVKYVDQNGDNIIDQYDVVPIGYASGYPEMYFSAIVGFQFKGFGVDALFQGVANQTLYLNTKSVFWPLVGQNSISTVSADRWTPETAETATLPRLTLVSNDNNYRKNDIWLANAKYLKMRYVDVYYQLPDKITGSRKISKASVYVRGMNLLSIDGIKHVDPEATGVTYPTLSSYHVGINIGF